MDDQPPEKKPVHQYPDIYEKIIPYILGFLVLSIVILVVITLGVASGFWANTL